MRVARWGLGSGAEVESDILAGIWRTWEGVSRLSMDVSQVLCYWASIYGGGFVEQN